MKHAPRRHAFVEPLESRLLMTVGELARNGAFEGTVSSADWVRGSAWQAGALGFTNYHGGTGYAYNGTSTGAYMNGTSGAAGSMYQQLTIPSTYVNPQLNLWTKITTQETTTTSVRDTMAVQVLNSSGTLLATLKTFSNLNSVSSTAGPYTATGKYALSTLSLAPYIGQTIRINLQVTTDASNGTLFRVDDVSVAEPGAITPGTSRQVVGYLPYYRQSSFSKMDLNLLTWINYFSLGATDAGGITTGNVSDTNLATVVNAAHAKGVRVSITVGPQSLNTMAASATARAAFVNNIKNYVTARNLDGIDIDWESPATGANQVNYGLLIDDLYAALHPIGKKITAAVNPWTKEIPVPATQKMDWVNVMCYDFDYANHSTYAASTDGMDQWQYYGVAKDKLVMGVPFYGRSGTSWSATTSYTYPTILNDYKAKNGSFPGPDVDSYVNSSGATVYFNGVTTMEKKAAFVRDSAYAGMFTWELGQDWWDSSSKYDPMSLLPVMSSMLRPPAWLSASPGSRFDYVNHQLIVAAGTVAFVADAGASDATLNVTIASGATATLNSSQRFNALTINGNLAITPGGNKTITTNSLSFTAAGKLDLADNDMVVRYTAGQGASATAGVESMVLQGFHGGDWLGATGITSSSAAIDARTMLAVVDNATLGRTSFSGVTGLTGREVLIKYTYSGDANLDGQVDIGDLGLLAGAWQQSGKTWFDGDFTYNGTIDIGDLGLLAGNWQKGVGNPL
jgi:chitinase